MRARLVLLAVAVAVVLTPVIAVLPAGLPGTLATVAAAGGLTTTADARYVVDPKSHKVRVAVALSATNHLSDTKTHRYFFDRSYLAVPPGTTGFKVTSPGAHPSVAVIARRSTYTMLRIGFGTHLASGSTRTFRLSFDIADRGGTPTRTTRIGLSLVRFSAWGLASDGATGGSVEVVFPPGFTVQVVGADLGTPTKDAAGDTVFTTGRLADPATFAASFAADRPSAFTESTLQVKVGADTVPITIRAWPDDPAWAKRVRVVLGKGLPVLAEEIGLPWTAGRPLVVQEAISRTTTGFAGRYDPSTGTMEVAYYADASVILHEAAHAWFDGSLLADRWANEGFASWYALQAATAIGLRTPAGNPLTPALHKVVVPLNAWGPAVADAAPTAADATRVTAENAEYAAALTLAGLIAKRAGPDGMHAVWQAIHDRRAAYQPVDAAAPEPADAAPDWRGLLDLLEDRTGADFGDLWSAWVVRPSEASLLADRAGARSRYAAVLARAGAWHLPPIVRDALRVWRYDQVGELLDAASHALDDRDAIAASAASVGLTPPPTMQTDFEGTRGFAAASAEAEAELAAIDAYRTAAAARPAQTDLLQGVGLWNADPAGSLASAASAFSAGDLAASVRDSAFARQTWQTADEVGRNRLLAISASLAALLVATWLAVRWYRDRGVRRRTLLTDG